jgi:hypothetical protein
MYRINVTTERLLTVRYIPYVSGSNIELEPDCYKIYVDFVSSSRQFRDSILSKQQYSPESTKW